MTLITKALRLLVGVSTIPVILLAIQRSARYRISWSLLLQLLLLTIQFQMNFNWRYGGIIGRIEVTNIGGYLIEINFCRGVSVTAMTVRFGLWGRPNTVNRMTVTALHHITNHSFVSIDMFAVWLVHKHENFLGYQLDAMVPSMYMRIYKRHDLS